MSFVFSHLLWESRLAYMTETALPINVFGCANGLSLRSLQHPFGIYANLSHYVSATAPIALSENLQYYTCIGRYPE